MKTWLIGLAGFVLGAIAVAALVFVFVPRPHDIMARADAFEPENRDWFFQNAAEVFPTRTVARGESGAPFETVDGALDGFSYEWEGQDRSLDDLFTDMETSGLIVLHDGRITYEAYDRGAGPGTRLTTWSLVKSITSTMVGFAVFDGLIDSVDDPLTTYLPELAGTAYEGVTIKQAMQMSSGVRFDRDRRGLGKDTIDFITDSSIMGRRSAFEIAISHPRETEPGTKFNYNTAESQVLLELVRRVTGKTAAAYLEEKAWRPLGMAHDAGWILDAPGEGAAEIGGALFNATLRDWARFGQFVEQDGVWNGERMLPVNWVERATTSDAPHIAVGEVHPNENRGYGWHWWTLANGAFIASGANGQSLYVDQANDLVVARSSAWPRGWVAEYDAQSYEMFKALGDWFAEDPIEIPSADIPAEATNLAE